MVEQEVPTGFPPKRRLAAPHCPLDLPASMMQSLPFLRLPHHHEHTMGAIGTPLRWSSLHLEATYHQQGVIAGEVFHHGRNGSCAQVFA